MGLSPEHNQNETIQPNVTPSAALEELSPDQRDFLIRLNFFGEGPILRGMLRAVMENADDLEETLNEFAGRGLIQKKGEDGPYVVSELGRESLALMGLHYEEAA